MSTCALRARVVGEARQRELLGERVPARRRPGLEHQHLEPGGGEVGRADQPVVARADHDDVDLIGNLRSWRVRRDSSGYVHRRPLGQVLQSGAEQVTASNWLRSLTGCGCHHNDQTSNPQSIAAIGRKHHVFQDQSCSGAAHRPRVPRVLRRAGLPGPANADEIPLEARIIFACDAFHAMTTDRPYREALPVEEAFRRLDERRRHAVRPTRRRDLPARTEQPPPAATELRSRRAAARWRALATGTAARAGSVVPFGGSSGSAVDSSCAQRRPNRVGGRTNVTGSRQALKRTMNDSSATGSPSAVGVGISAPLRKAPSANASPRAQLPWVIRRPSGRNHQTSGAPDRGSSPVRNAER